MSEREQFARLLTEQFSVAGRLTEAQLDLLWRHYALLVRWNKVINLTSIDSMEEAVIRHYSESLFVGLQLPPEPVSVLDIGSGAGFPGIPMAVMRPDCRVALVESHARKAAFLREATRDLPNLRVLARRAESLEETFDWVVSRAVAWKQLRRSAAKLGRTVGLLLSSEDAQTVAGTGGFAWELPRALPWSRQSVFLTGTVRST